ncbi:MBL fold metallo-hydrolase [Jatrophihabitans sp. YIM 134969]
MRLTVLGCSGSVPGPDSPASGYVVEHEGFRVVMDLGPGAAGGLLDTAATEPPRVDAVLISHLHADHCLDLVSLATSLRYGRHPGVAPVPVYGPVGLRQRIVTAYGYDAGLDELFDFVEDDVPAELGPFAISTAVMNHPVPTRGFRLSTGGSSLTYSADTGQSPALVALATGSDALLCEATYAPGDPVVPDLHLSGRDAGEHAARAGVGRLLVTHVPPWSSPAVAVDEALAVFDGPVEAVTAGAGYEL